MVLLLICASAFVGRGSHCVQGGTAVLAQGDPPLTQQQFDNFVFYWEMYLDIKLTRDEREELKRDVLQYWTTHNTAEIQNTLKQAEDGAANRDLPQSALADMRTAYQAQHLAGLRSEPNDPMSVLLLKLYDRVHGFGGGSDNSAAAGGAILAPGNPPLTRGMVEKFLDFYKFILDLKFSDAQRSQLQSIMVEGWRKNDQQVVSRVVGDLQFVDHKTKEEVKTALREDYQVTIVSGMRQYINKNLLLARLVEDFDRAHPERRDATRAKGFADLVGTWEWDDALLQDRDQYSRTARGIGYVEAGKLEIAPDGKYKLIRTHRHCEGACCNEQGKSESGTVSVEGGELVFLIKAGTQMTREGCNARVNQQSAISPYRESYNSWSITPNPNHNNAPTLCWNTGPKEATCYIKRQ